LRKPVLMGLFSAELYELWRVCHKSGKVLHGQLSNKIDSIAGSDFFLT